MKKTKRLVAAFLAGMMMLAMLTACGGSVVAPPEKSDFMNTSAALTFETSSIPKISEDLDKIIADLSYASAVELTKDSSSDNYLNIVKTWSTACCNALGVDPAQTFSGSSRFASSMSPESIKSLVAEQINEQLDKYSTWGYNLTDYSYSVQSFYIDAPIGNSDSGYVIFWFLYNTNAS